MIVIKTIVALIMTHKLFIHPLFPQIERKLLFWKDWFFTRVYWFFRI